MKKHLPLLKETLQFVVLQLRSSDKLCIVTFDHEVWRMEAAYPWNWGFMAFDCLQVKTELPLTAMTTSGKLLAERAIDGVKERGHTNLSGGLLAALEALYRHGTSNISHYYSAFNSISFHWALQDTRKRSFSSGISSPVH